MAIVTQQGPAGAPYTKASGNTDLNTMRVVLADDSPGASGGAAPFNANITQIKGTAISTGNGVTDAGTQRVTIATDSPITIDADTINLNTDQLEALATTGNTNTSAISGKLPATLGQKAMAASMAVVVASDQSTLPVSEQAAVVTTSTTLNAVSSTVNGTTIQISGSNTVSFNVTGTFVGTITFQGSNDDTNFVNLTISSGGVLGSTATAPGVYAAAIPGMKSVRANMTWTSGTSATVTVSATPLSSSFRTIQLGTALPTGTNSIGSIASITTSIVPGTAATNLGKAEDAASVSGDTGVLALGVRNDTGATLTSNDLDYGAVTVDAAGRSIVTLGTLISGEDQTNNVLRVEQHFSYQNITTNTTTTVKSGAGFLHRITINTKGASSNTITVYDNTAGSGTKIGTIDSTAGVTSLEFNVVFSTGLTLVTATGTAADITVSYR